MIMEMFNLIYDHILIDSRKRNRDINGDDDDDDDNDNAALLMLNIIVVVV